MASKNQTTTSGPGTPTQPNTERPRLKQRYESEIRSKLQEELALTNTMQVPRMAKIVVNMGVGRATQQRSLLDGAITDLQIITGQKPMIAKAKKSIATFKLREGNEIGAKVTLRSDRMWEFYDRLVTLAIPRIRDFRGMPPNQFDGHGNYTFGVTEQLIFPEIDYDTIDSVRGMNVTIVTTANSDDHGRALLRALGFPFRRDGQG
jgi:large subunit ribosomal protein L5